MYKKLKKLCILMAIIMMLFLFAIFASAKAGSSIATARNIEFGKTYSESITLDEEDYYKFTLTSSGRITFKITSYMQYYCAYIYDEDGNQLWYTDSNEWISTTGKRSDTYNVDLEKGTYYLKINGYRYSSYYASTGNYKLTLTYKASGANIAEPNNNIAQAKKIEFSKNIKGIIAVNDAEDYYKFIFASSGRITFKITSYMQYYCAYIYDEDGNQLWYTDSNEWISTTEKRSDTYKVDLEKGTYYLKINGYRYSTYYASTGNYNFTLTYKASGANIAEPNNSIPQAKSIKHNVEYKGQIAENDRDDYYKFTLSSSGKLNFKITSYMQYYCAVIYNKDGKEVWYTDSNEWISTTEKRSDTYNIDLGKGTYYLKINGYRYSSYYASTGNYTFKIYRSVSVPKVEGFKASPKTTSSITLSWKKASGVAGYTVYKYTPSNKKYTKIADITNTSYTIKNLNDNSIYRYAVRAYKKVDGSFYYGAYSAVLTTATKPAAPTLKVTAGTKQAKLTWNKVTGATGYEIYYSTSKDSGYKKLASSSSASYTAKKLTTGKTYYFKIRAYKTVSKTNIYSGYSAVKSVKVK